MGETIIPSISEIKKTRSGNKFSRFFRHIFEHKSVKKYLSMNIVLLAFGAAVVPAGSNAFQITESDLPETIMISGGTELKTERNITYPVENHKVNQGYHAFHPGIDFEGEIGDPVHPVMPGTIEAVQYYQGGEAKGISSSAYGNAVLVRHTDEITSLYAHLSSISVTEDEFVDTFSVIGEVGSTGRSTGSHLHLEVRKNDFAVNPLSILPN